MFNVSSIVVNSGNVTDITWYFENADGRLGGTHKCSIPYGAVPLNAITEATLVGWLTDQLTNTEAELIAALTDRAAKAAHDANNVEYTVNDAGALIAS